VPYQIGPLNYSTLWSNFLTHQLFLTPFPALRTNCIIYSGLGMNNPSYIGDIWSGNDTPEPLIYKFLLGNAWQGLIIVSIGAVTGGLATVICVKKLGEKTIQVTGFLFLFFLFIIIGGSFKTLMDDGRNSAIVVLYLLCQVFFNFG
jgi:PHS family inorganic phosphate transporter-like MFS transporter